WRRTGLLDGGVRVVRLAHRRSAGDSGGLTGIARIWGHTGRHWRRGNDAQLGAAEVADDRASRDGSSGVVAEQGDGDASRGVVAGVAAMQAVMRSPDPLSRAVLLAVYPRAEIATVGYLGALCDRIGRKRILAFAHLVTAAAVFLFILSIGVDPGVQPYLVAVFFAMFGIGAAAKVASTLAMINDHSNRANRAQLLAF